MARASGRAGRVLAGLWLAMIAVGAGAVMVAGAPRLPTTVADFYFHGTQPTTPGVNFATMLESQYCAGCHGGSEQDAPQSYSLPANRWQYSMMSQAYRDPIFQAQLQIAEKDAAFSGDACLKCHAPAGWVQNRAHPTDGSGLQALDQQGVSCSVCHRQVDPDFKTGNPGIDQQVLVALGANRPPNFGGPADYSAPGDPGPLASNHYVIDPEDRRRGPYNLGPTFFFHEWAESQFHRSSGVCASCHDVSNPAFSRQPDGRYVLNAVDTPHPTGNKYDMYPLDRTYSEWLKSDFGRGAVLLTVPNPNPPAVAPWGQALPHQPEIGRFAFDGVTMAPPIDPATGLPYENPEAPGEFYLDPQFAVYNGQTAYSSCQDCHMPKSTGTGCEPFLNPPVRSGAGGVPVHNFAGGNSWVLRSVWDLFGFESGMSDPTLVDESVRRNENMLRLATDVAASVEGTGLRVRVTNQTGHKFPAGFSEGRRAWVNVRFLDAQGAVVEERGAYDAATATLDVESTKVYQAKHGIDLSGFPEPRPAGTNLAGLSDGPSFHLDLNNRIFFDNRIPPRGFNNVAFAAVQAAPVGYAYADGQHWDDTLYVPPAGAVRAEVRVFMQTTTREYVEFLRDNASEPDGTAPEAFTPLPQPRDPSNPEDVAWELPAGFSPARPLSTGEIAYAQWIKWGRSTPVEVDLVTVDLGPVACNVADIVSIGGFPPPDGELTVDDYTSFINAFAGDELVADIVSIGGFPPADGELTVDDYTSFINAFAEGC